MAIRDLKGKRVFITGAASGIGAATAIAFARAGCDLVVADLDSEGLTGTAQAVEACGVRCEVHGLDVTDAGQFEALAIEVSAATGVPDVVVNNAGIGAHGSFLNTPMETARRVFEVNLFGVYNGCHAFIPRMLKAEKPCHIVNVASLASISPMPNTSAYSASKYAVDGLTEVLSLELHDSNVGFTCVHPGIINTPIVIGDSFNGELGRQQAARLAEYYKTNGDDPAVVARDVVAAVRKGSAHLWTGAKSSVTEKVKRLSPSLLRRMTLHLAKETGFS
jgi:NAD(P)-dependent dehydrogenase (short-subunit alcohol dehydrogenase family)